MIPQSASSLLGDFLGLLIVAALWGITNPLIKRGSQGIGHSNASSYLGQHLLDIRFLFGNMKFLLPFLLNQCGSVLYYICVARAGYAFWGVAGNIYDLGRIHTTKFHNISLVVPLTNTMTFMFTTVTGYLLGEKITKGVIFGVCLVCVGVTLCVLGKA